MTLRISLQPKTALVPRAFSTGEKLWNFIPAIRQRLLPRRHLIAGPFVGEFGYELMQWQAYVRGRKKYYDSVHVVTYPGRDYLYEGCTVHEHDLQLKDAGYGYGWMPPERISGAGHEIARQLGLRDYDLFNATLLCTRYHKILCWKQDFRLFKEPPLSGGMRDLAFHFRAIRKEGPDHMKNYAPELAAELVACCVDAGLRVLCVGHPDYSIAPPGAEDCRTVVLRETVRALNSVHAVAGENSGPMHLANLCGKPTILWAQDQWRIDYSLRWNPFQVPIYVVANDTVQPEARLVSSKILSALNELRERTSNHSLPPYAEPAKTISWV